MEVKVQRERLQCFLIKLRGFWLHSAALKHVGQPWRGDRAKGVIAADRNLLARWWRGRHRHLGFIRGREKRQPIAFQGAVDRHGGRERKEAGARKGREGDKACNQQTRNHSYDAYKQNASHWALRRFHSPLFPYAPSTGGGNRTKRARASSVGALFSPACDAHAHTCVRRGRRRASVRRRL